jgi:hypothetical protein
MSQFWALIAHITRRQCISDSLRSLNADTRGTWRRNTCHLHREFLQTSSASKPCHWSDIEQCQLCEDGEVQYTYDGSQPQTLVLPRNLPAPCACAPPKPLSFVCQYLEFRSMQARHAEALFSNSMLHSDLHARFHLHTVSTPSTMCRLDGRRWLGIATCQP